MHEKQIEIMKLIQENPKITIRELKDITGLSSTSHVDYHLTRLIIDGYVKRINGFKVLKRVEV